MGVEEKIRAEIQAVLDKYDARIEVDPHYKCGYKIYKVTIEVYSNEKGEKDYSEFVW